MNAVGKQCKIYPLKKFREFNGWVEKQETRKAAQEIVDSQELALQSVLDNEEYVYLQDNYNVTRSIFKEKNIIFDAVTPEWIEFCQKVLNFNVSLFAQGEFVTLSPPQHWFLKTFSFQAERFTGNVSFDVYQLLNKDLLNQAILHLMSHHDILRARFVQTGQGWQQVIVTPNVITPFLIFDDLSACSPEEQNNALLEIIRSLQISHNIAVAPLLRIAYLNLGPNLPAKLLISIHHLIMDGLSMSILLGDLQRIYLQISAGQPLTLPQKTAAFKTYTEQLLQHIQKTVPNELDYWLHLPWSDIAPLPMDTPEGRPDDTYARQQSVSIEFDTIATTSLLRFIEKYPDKTLQLKHLLLTALVLTFKQWGGLASIFMRFEHLARTVPLNNLDLSRTVGWIATTSHMLLTLKTVDEPDAALATIFQQIRALPMEGLGVGLLEHLADDAEYAEVVKPILSLPQPQFSFNFFSNMANATASHTNQPSLFGPPVEITSGFGDFGGHRNDPLEIFGQLGEKGLTMNFSYGPSVYQAATMDKLASLYRKNLMALVKTP